MTQEASKTVNGNKGAKNPALPQDDKFFDLTTNPLQYKPETCAEWTVQGRILSFEKMPYAEDQITKEKTKMWFVFNIEATAETKGEDIDGEIKTVPVGEVVRVPMNEELKIVLSQFRAATIAGQLVEVRIKPIKKSNLGGGRTMWRYSVQLDKPDVRKARPAGLPAYIDSSNTDFANLFPDGSGPVRGQLTEGNGGVPF